jgi:flagellar biosynthesis/type III secretory pathway M-ring protein FliF/YscJ
MGAVGTGVVVIVVAVAIVLVVLLVTASMRSRLERGEERHAEAHHDLGEAQDRAIQAEHELDINKGAGDDPSVDERAPRSGEKQV